VAVRKSAVIEWQWAKPAWATRSIEQLTHPAEMNRSITAEPMPPAPPVTTTARGWLTGSNLGFGGGYEKEIFARPQARQHVSAHVRTQA
jgi:hypothetical protein